MAFGFDATTGWVAPTFADLLADFATKYEVESGVTIDLGIESPTLDFARTVSRMFKAAYDSGYGAYASGFVPTAEGAGLRNLLYPFIGEPLPDSFSEVVLPLDGTGGTIITAGSTVKLDSDGPGAVGWVLQGNVELPGNGTFRYPIAGPKSAAADSAWTIGTPVVGWSTAGPNVEAADRGRLAETELEYRQRFSLSVQGTRILAAVLAVDGVTSANLFENPTDVPDAEWGATHWIEVLVQGGSDAAVAAAIQSTRAFGTQTVGSETETVPAPGYPGGEVDISFSRPNLIDVWTSLAITKGEGYPGDTSSAAVAARELAIRNHILAWAALRAVGLDVTSFQIAAIASSTPAVPGIANIVATVDTDPSPATTSVVAGPRDLLVFSAARISLTGV